MLLMAAAIFGAHLLEAELNVKASTAGEPFLRQLPIGPWTILGAKLGAAVTYLLLLLAWIFTVPALLSNVLSPWPFFAAVYPQVLGAALLAWAFAAWLSALGWESMSSVLTTLFVTLAAVFTIGALYGLPATLPVLVQGAGVLLTVVLAADIRRRLGSPEQRTAGPEAILPGGLGRHPRLWALELRRIGRSLAIFLAALVVLPLVYGDIFLVGILGPFAGALLGSQLYWRDERDSTSFFVHHLPIARRTLVAWRCAIGLGFGAVVFGIALVVEMVRGDAEGAVALTGLLAMLYVFAFALGAMLSPWLGSPILAATLAFMTWAVWLTRVDETLFDPLLAAMTATAVVLAWWSAVHSRALEPGPHKMFKAVALLVPFWAVWLATA